MQLRTEGEVVAVTPDIAVVIDDCAAAGPELLQVLDRLDEPDLRAASSLPDWTRAHVLAHVVNVGDGVARQVEYAARGEFIDFYDGGQTGRNAAIEATAALPKAELQALADRTFERVAEVWPPVGAPLWDHPVRYRAGTVVDVLLTWWREVRVHLVDLDVGIDARSWSDELCRHLIDFLMPRLPGDTPVELRVDGVGTWTAGDGASSEPALVVEGDLRDVTMWLAGRQPEREPTASADGRPRELPELLPWPSPRQ